MNRTRVLVAVASLALAAGLVLAAHEELRGTVISIDGDTDTIVVRMDNGSTKTLRYDSTLDVLNIGRDDYVLVKYDEDAAGNLLAHSVDETDRLTIENETNRQMSELHGRVVSIDRDNVVVRLNDGRTKTLRVDSGLDVVSIGRDDYVLVRYNEDPNGSLVAMSLDETDSGIASNELPRTASPLPLVALIGLGSLAAGFVVRRIRNAH
jgi:hypothetical protein